METLVGSTLGGYTLTRVIGSGGMGTVYLAEDAVIGQQVAIKVVQTELSAYIDIMSREQVADRFRQEARAVASLDHLNILPLYRYGEEQVHGGTRSYMVMQYRPEGSLWAWMRRRAGITPSGDSSQASDMTPPGLPTGWPLRAEETADYVQQAAAALQYAHDRGLIHRDVKPENFLLRFDKHSARNSYQAFLLLSDFGLAKFFSHLTSTSQILGTPTYMAPEQFSGNACPESDQYALALVAYCLLAGQPPFSGDPIHLMTQHLSTPAPSIRLFVPQLSTQTEAVFDKALAKDPSARYRSIAEFASAFTHSIFRGRGAISTTSLSDKTHPSSVAAEQQQSAQQKVEKVLPTPTHSIASSQQKHPHMDTPPMPATPLVAHQAQDRLHSEYYRNNPISSTRSGSQQEPQLQIRTPANSQPGFTPADDGRYMQGSIQKVTRRKAAAWLIGGTVVAGIAAVGSGFYLTISAIGQQSKARPPQSHKRYTLHGHEQAVSSLAWSPDGSRLASGSLDRSVRVWNLDQPEMPLIIKSQKSGIQALAWEPSGTRIAAGARDNSIQIYIAADGSLDKAFISRNAAISRLAWSRDADTLFVSTLRNGLEKITLSTGAIEQAGTRASFRTLAVSPNGRYVAVGMDNGFLLIFSLPELSRLYTGHQHKGSIRALAWSPDSIYLASGGTDESLQVLNVTTKQVTNRVTLNALINDIAWQPRATPGTERVAAGLADGSIRIWSPGNNNLALYKEHTTAVNAVSWGRQGLASGSNDKTIIVWNV